MFSDRCVGPLCEKLFRSAFRHIRLSDFGLCKAFTFATPLMDQFGGGPVSEDAGTLGVVGVAGGGVVSGGGVFG